MAGQGDGWEDFCWPCLWQVDGRRNLVWQTRLPSKIYPNICAKYFCSPSRNLPNQSLQFLLASLRLCVRHLSPNLSISVFQHFLCLRYCERPLHSLVVRPMPHRTWRNLLYTAWDLFWILTDERLSTLRSKASLRLQGCPYGDGFATTGPCSFKARTEGSICIGSGVRFLAGWRSNRVGLTGRVLLQTFGEGRIFIGDNSGGSACVLSSRSSITLGKHVNLGGNVRIFDHDFHPLDPQLRRLGEKDQAPHIRTAPVVVGDDVFVGANAIILKGVTLGDRAIVAAGAVVFKGDYTPGSLLVGNPATVVKKM